MSSRSDKTRVERYPLPNTIDGICSTIRDVLSGGSVQRMELDVDEPLIRVVRTITDVGLEEPDIGWDAALRNVEVMLEYSSENASSFQVLVDMFLLVQQKKLIAACWAAGTGDEGLLDKWLELVDRGMPPQIPGLLGLPIYFLKSLPEESLILCASRYPNPEPNEISFAVRTAIELRRSHDPERVAGGEVADSIRSDSREHPTTVDQLEVVAGELFLPSWGPSREPGE
jgi:hypothetical protein